MSEIIQYYSDFTANIGLLTETWQTSSMPGRYDSFSAKIKELAAAEKYLIECIACPRPSGRRGGGVATIFETHLNVKRYSIRNTYETFESVFTIVRLNKLNFVLGSIYRVPTDFSFQSFMEEFTDLLTLLAYEHRPVILAGDFNVRMNSPHTTDTSSFSSLISEFDLLPILPVTATHQHGNILDFAIASSSLISSVHSISVDSSITISDHYPISLSLVSDSLSYTPPSLPRNRRLFNKLDHTAFSLNLSQSLTSIESNPTTTLKDYLFSFNDAIIKTLDQLAPSQEITSKGKENPGWMDQEYIEARSLRRRYQKQGDKPAYNRQNKTCARLVKQKRKTYYSSLFNELNSTNQQKLFKTFNELFDHNKKLCSLPSHTDPLTLANSFNNYFLTKVSKIRSDLPTSSDHLTDTLQPLSPSNSNQYQLSSFDLTTVDELRLLIKKHGIKTSTNDPLPDFLIEQNLELLLPHFCILVNLSLSTSNFDGLKEAHVVPILKSMQLDSELFKNFRPVSLLSFISKLTERVVHNRINTYLSANDLHVPSQFGYKRHHSCETFLLKLIDDILVTVDSKLGVVVLIIDLSAAFDTVDHTVLLHILQSKFNINGSALAWLKSFLSDRTQRVKIGDSLSSSLTILYGVPQGSILGPLLFNLYCSSLTDAFSHAGFNSMGYADDNLGLRVFPAFSKLSTLFSDVPSCLSSISKWTNAHFLKLNSNKTHVMFFGNKSFKQSVKLSGCLNSSGSLIPFSPSTKLLGVHLDDTLSFDLHVSKTVSSSLIILKNVRSIRKLLTPEAAATLIHAIITSKLDQCNSLLFNVSLTNLAKLQRIQNFALRTVLNLRPRSQLTQHFQELHWLTVEQRIHFKILTITFKCIHCLAPTPLAVKVKLSSPFDMLLDPSQFYPTSVLGRRAFSYSAPRCWNALPRSLRVIPCLDTFKAYLKHHLFTNFPSYLHAVNPYT